MWQPPAEVYLRPVHQAHELEIWPLDPARQRDCLVQMVLGLVEVAGPGLGIADFEKRQRTELLTTPRPPSRSTVTGSVRGQHPGRSFGRREQLLCLLSPRPL